jgi:hypothetical protein
MTVFTTLAARARPAIQACNPTRTPRHANIDVFVNHGNIGMVIPTSEDAGDKETARCVAGALKAASSPAFGKDEDGIFKRATFRWR